MADAAIDPLQSLLSTYPSGVLLLRDSLAASGHFLLPWITAAAVKQGHKVVFIAAAYSPAKHQAALRKLGVTTTSSSSSSQQTGPVAFVSVSEAARQQQQQQSCLRLLYQQVQAAAAELSGVNAQQQQQQQQQQQGLTVVLDSLPVLSALSYCDAGGGGVSSSSSSQLQALVHQLMALGENLQVPSYRLILLAARDVPCQHQLLSSVASRAHVTADINPLEGKTAALDGSLTIHTRRAPTPRTRPLLPPQHHLQLQESLQSGDDAALRTAPAAGAAAAVVAGGNVVGSVCPGWLSVCSSSVWLFRCGDVAIKWMREVHGKELMG